MFDKRVSRVTAGILIACGVFFGVFGTIMLIRGLDDYNRLFNPTSSTWSIISAVFGYLTFIFALWEGIYTIVLLNEMGVEYAFASELKTYAREKRASKYLNGSGQTGNYQNNGYNSKPNNYKNTGFNSTTNNYQSTGFNSTSNNYQSNGYNSNPGNYQKTGFNQQPQYNNLGNANNRQDGVIASCPYCQTNMKLPAGRGQISAECPKCKGVFSVRT